MSCLTFVSYQKYFYAKWDNVFNNGLSKICGREL